MTLEREPCLKTDITIIQSFETILVKRQNLVCEH